MRAADSVLHVARCIDFVLCALRAGTVYAFDVQQLAINATRQRLATLPQSASPRIHVLKQCHSTMREVTQSQPQSSACATQQCV